MDPIQLIHNRQPAELPTILMLEYQSCFDKHSSFNKPANPNTIDSFCEEPTALYGRLCCKQLVSRVFANIDACIELKIATQLIIILSDLSRKSYELWNL